MKKGMIITYKSNWEDRAYTGLITRKASSGYWVLWCTGEHKIIPRSLLKHTKIIQE